MALGYLLIRSVPLVRMYETDIIYQFQGKMILPFNNNKNLAQSNKDVNILWPFR